MPSSFEEIKPTRATGEAVLTECLEELKTYIAFIRYAFRPMDSVVGHLGSQPDLYGLYPLTEWLLLFSSQLSFAPLFQETETLGSEVAVGKI